MTPQQTERLLLIPTPLFVLQKRMQCTDFMAEVTVGQQELSVHFPEEYPGDAMVLFPVWIELHNTDPDTVPWGGTVIERKSLTAIGQMGCKGWPEEGYVEIGYGINPSFQRQGYGTEIVRAFTQWLLAQPNVHTVTAECLTDNYGSRRILENCGFERVGTRIDVNEGELFLWRKH